MNRIKGPRRRRVRIEHLDELIGRKSFDDDRSRKLGNAEPSGDRLERERDAVDDEASAHRDFQGTTARTERPATSWRQGREEDALVSAEGAWSKGRSTVAQVFAARKATQLSAPQLVCHDGGVLQGPRSKGEVELLLHEIHMPIGENELQSHLRMSRQAFRDDLGE